MTGTKRRNGQAIFHALYRARRPHHDQSIHRIVGNWDFPALRVRAQQASKLPYLDIATALFRRHAQARFCDTVTSHSFRSITARPIVSRTRRATSTPTARFRTRLERTLFARHPLPAALLAPIRPIRLHVNSAGAPTSSPSAAANLRYPIPASVVGQSGGSVSGGRGTRARY